MVLAVLSMASVQGTKRVPLTDFYAAFAGLVEAHRDLFPPMHFTKNASSISSKRLDDALQSFIGGSVELPNPRLQFLEVGDDAAKRHLAWLGDKYGQDAVNSIEPLTREFLDRMASPNNSGKAPVSS